MKFNHVAPELIGAEHLRRCDHGMADRPAAGGRTQEFLVWAREHAAHELAELIPDGEIDPTGDHPERFRRLLVRWRQAAGLAPLDFGDPAVSAGPAR